MKLKRFAALLTALMLSLTIAYADTTATRIYDAVVDLLTNTTNVTLTGNAIFSLDGKQFKTVETTYEQDGVNSRWVLNMTSPRANGSLKNSGFTIIANNRFKYAMEVFNPGTYKFVECDPQSAILRSSVVLTRLVSLGHTVVNQIPEWSGNEVSRTNDGKLFIHLTDEQIPVSVNDLLGLGVLLAVQRTLSIVDDSVVTPAYPAEANTFEASVTCTTPTRAIINHTEKYELTALSAEIGMDESGRLTEASGTAHFVLHTFQDGDHELDISFSGKVFDYGNSHVPAFDATEYKVVPEAGTVIPLDIYNENSENYDLSENALLSSIIQDDYPDYQLFDYAPIGQGNAEYIILARDSASKPVAMIVNTEQPAAGVEFCNTSIMEGIPLDKNTVQIMDHMLDGHPYIEYNNPDGQDFLYVIFCKNADGRWYVTEAQFGDEWNDIYWFRHNDRDQKIHVYLAGNELMALPDDTIDRTADGFDPEEAREYLRSALIPFSADHQTVAYDRTAEECNNLAWLMSGAGFDDLLENLTDRIASRQMYSVTGTVKYIIPGTPQRAVFEISDYGVPFSLLISNVSNMEWTEGSSFRVYAEAYAYSETERMPWLMAGYTFSK